MIFQLGPFPYPPGAVEQRMFGVVTMILAVPATGVYFLPDHPSVHVKNTMFGQDLHNKVVNVPPMPLERADVCHEPFRPAVVAIVTSLLPFVLHTLLHCLDPCIKDQGRIFS